MSFIWIFLSYLAGSIPFGFIIGKLSGKNVLEVGWKKTSGSNVYKNVGKKQGILTGLLDAAKGFLVVWLAKELGFSPEIQVLSGVAAVTGHNWSIFLNFSGGRGVGTLAGAFLALSPKIFGLAFIPFFILTFTWNASIATIGFLIFAVIFSLNLHQFQTAGYFTLLSLIPIFVKRLSPISELINKKEGRWPLFRNRIIFDRDEFIRDLRINRIFREEKSKRLSLALKIISYPLLIPPKISWKLAKYGFNMVKKPISLLKNQEKSIYELGPEDLKKMMIAAAKKIVAYQEEINRMNVFPVADKDTGYNLAATLLGIEGLVSRKKYSRIREIAEDIKEAAMINARGNAGMIFTAYLIELLDRLKHLETINASHLAFAMVRGIKAARNAVAQPVEGTVLDILAAAGNKAYELTVLDKEKKRQKKNIVKILEEAVSAGKKALDETPEKLAVLKQNNVVDAGGFGFLKVLEAWTESLKGLEISQKIEDTVLDG
jgi:acyl-phosphate glycerol 3-phosphate acyltransferase